MGTQLTRTALHAQPTSDHRCGLDSTGPSIREMNSPPKSSSGSARSLVYVAMSCRLGTGGLFGWVCHSPTQTDPLSRKWRSANAWVWARSLRKKSGRRIASGPGVPAKRTCAGAVSLLDPSRMPPVSFPSTTDTSVSRCMTRRAWVSRLMCWIRVMAADT